MLDVSVNVNSTAMTTPASLGPARYPFPALENLPEDIRTRILEIQEKAGFIPNVFLGLRNGGHFLPTTMPSWPKKKVI